jgi:hypothetical protein
VSSDPAEQVAVRKHRTAVAVFHDLHQSASPTFWRDRHSGKDTADASNPQAAVAPDTEVMVNAARPADRAAQASAKQIQQSVFAAHVFGFSVKLLRSTGAALSSKF